MVPARISLGFAIVLVACDFDDKPPPAPDGYPKLGAYQEGEAELVIDGEHYVTEDSGGTSYNVEGGFDDELRAHAQFDSLSLGFRDVEVGVYTIASGDLTASYSYDVNADRECGDGQIEIIGRRHYDAGITGEREFIWGTIQLELCETDLDDVIGTMEVSGRFTSIVTRR